MFYDILLMEQVRVDNSPVFQNTELGWLIGGNLSFLNDTSRRFSCNLALDDTLNQTLLKFWQIEEPVLPKATDEFCERHFLETHTRDETGRFVVQIPFKDNLVHLGDSKVNALRSLEYLDRRLARNPDLKKEYFDFISEYQSLGHMTELKGIDWRSSLDNECFILPHHAVIKELSLTWRLRVVFNASSKTSSGLSLNDVQHTGPAIQGDLVSILTRFRKHKYILNADVSKMFRQIWIDPKHRPYQRILWRDDTGDINCYELNTVVYGMASSPFLAVRCLHQAANEHESEYPVATHAIKNDMFMDDLLTGSDNEEELVTLQRDISHILASVGFDLRKWLSNKRDFCDNFEFNDSLKINVLQLGENEQSKTLGVYWNAYLDSIQYRIRQFSGQTSVTKRKILSISSQIFDPLGLVQPVILTVKLMIQRLWKEKSDWDSEVSDNLRDEWNKFCLDLRTLNDLQVSRRVLIDNMIGVELHVFADASERAYGAAIYVRSVDIDGLYYSHLLCAKSKVAPTRQPTLPRLELSAALIAARLTKKVLDTIDIKIDKVFYWSDSTITLCWIKGTPSRFKTFVKNRINEIQTLTDPQNWFHVRSEDNPADLVSRGSTALNLISNQLWSHGPTWLRSGSLPLASVDKNMITTLPEELVVTHTAIIDNYMHFDLFSKFSSLSKLVRVLGYCYRFINNIRSKVLKKERVLSKNLKVDEFNYSLKNLIRISQIQSFGQTYFDLMNNKQISKSSSIVSLNPFIDQDKLLRVGGRIQNSNVCFNKKFPIILHNKHKLTKLIFENIRKAMLHCGPQQLLYTVRQKYWAISGRSLARSVVLNCIVCFKAKPKTIDYLMGSLPYYRVNQFFPFMHCGCDYAGPFLIKDRKTRNPKMTKAYVVIFICMTVKAIHLELVTDLTSEAFLATFKRFIARRGKPSHFYCDNGTTFVGANAEIVRFLKTESQDIERNLNSEGINFHFIPPRAPNFGGLWESGVKSCKYHLKRVIGNTHLHYEDFMTVLTQVEGVLNSRPISPMSSNPDDFTPLCPSHFLIGRPVSSIPEPCLTQVPENRLTHFKRLQQIMQHFWQRWYREYISELQSRQKWFQEGASKLRIGDLVLVKEDNLPPLRWKTVLEIRFWM